MPRPRGGKPRLDVIREQARRESHDSRAGTWPEPPFQRPPRARAEYRVVGSQLGWPRRRPAPRQIVWTRNDESAHLPDAPHQKGGIRQCADPHGDVQGLVDEIEIAIVEDQLHLTLRKFTQERGHDRGHVAPAELPRSRDPEEAANGCRRDIGHCFVVRAQQRSRLLHERTPRLGRGKAPRSPLDEARADAMLQCGQCSCYRRRGASQTSGGAHQASLLDDGYQHSELIQTVQAIIPIIAIMSYEDARLTSIAAKIEWPRPGRTF